MNIAFTICSNNYLAQAKTLGDTLTERNKDFTFFIGLVDKKSNKIDYSFFPYEIISADEIGIEEFDALCTKYNIVELNTAVKPSYFKFLITRFQNAQNIFYLDPDLMVFDSFKSLLDELETNDIILTPHITNPIVLDNCYPGENVFLNYGLYNLGFLGLNCKSAIVQKFLDWWEERTLKLGFHDTFNGFFVDQLWINLVPLFFDRVKILHQFGYNAGPWNLHERDIDKQVQKRIYMNDGSALIFYHFSSYNFKTPDILSRTYNRYTFAEKPNFKFIYDIYQIKILNNRISEFSTIKCYYIEQKEERERKEYKRRFYHQLKQFLPPILYKIKNKLTQN